MTNAAATDNDLKPIRIFRKGTFTSVEGEELTFGEGELADIVSSYDGAADPAPLVVGHPKLDHPAYGWVDRLAVVDGEVFAYPDPALTEPAFAEMVNAGRYRKISASFYSPKGANNPRPGKYYLRHVGFLGAHPPSVKNLGTVSLGEADAGPFITFEQETDMSGTDPKEQEASFAERETKVAEREAAVKAREEAAAEAADKVAHDANVSFAEGLVAKAKLHPKGKDLLIGVLDGLGATDTVSFGEAGELTPRAALVKLFDDAHPLVSLGESAKDDGKAIGEEDPAAIAAAATSFAESQAKAGRPISMARAVAHVKNQAKKGA
ncbi:MAG: hypothetical protein J0H88_16300 [Sphingomonadales bacterium]|nr:hypothetical protein [Sphingomonadales bacterium]